MWHSGKVQSINLKCVVVAAEVGGDTMAHQKRFKMFHEAFRIAVPTSRVERVVAGYEEEVGSENCRVCL